MTVLNRIAYAEVNLEELAAFSADDEVSPETLVEAGIIPDLKRPVVILGRGDVGVSLNVKAHRISKGAQEKIEAAGGNVEIFPIAARE
jgi:large subunit ribosomal protein L15